MVKLLQLFQRLSYFCARVVGMPFEETVAASQSQTILLQTHIFKRIVVVTLDLTILFLLFKQHLYEQVEGCSAFFALFLLCVSEIFEIEVGYMDGLLLQHFIFSPLFGSSRG